MKIPDEVLRSPKFQALPERDKLGFLRLWTAEDEAADKPVRERMQALDRIGSGQVAGFALGENGEPWCAIHGYGCEPSNCPCGHTLRCDCWSISGEH